MLVPILTNEEYTQLKESIADVGLYEPIVINQDNVILDGHHRLKAVKDLGWEKINVERKNFENRLDEEIYVIETNVVRRHLNTAQKTIMGQKLEPLYQKKAEQNMKAGTLAPNGARVDVDKDVSKKIGLSERTYQRAKYVLENASPEEKTRFLLGEKRAGSVYKNLKIAEKIDQLRKEIPKINPVEGLFDVIVVDPPWPYEYYEQTGFRGGAIYPVMSIDKISNIKLPSKDNCVLWLWTTNRFLHDAYHILEQWGFEAKTVLTWAKETIGVGVWLRGQTEHCILAIKGHPIWNLKGQSTLLFAPNRGHSVKPEEFYKLLDSLCYGSKIDYFARKSREGWAVYGTMEDAKNVG